MRGEREAWKGKEAAYIQKAGGGPSTKKKGEKCGKVNPCVSAKGSRKEDGRHRGGEGSGVLFS